MVFYPWVTHFALGALHGLSLAGPLSFEYVRQQRATWHYASQAPSRGEWSKPGQLQVFRFSVPLYVIRWLWQPVVGVLFTSRSLSSWLSFKILPVEPKKKSQKHWENTRFYIKYSILWRQIQGVRSLLLSEQLPNWVLCLPEHTEAPYQCFGSEEPCALTGNIFSSLWVCLFITMRNYRWHCWAHIWNAGYGGSI